MVMRHSPTFFRKGFFLRSEVTSKYFIRTCFRYSSNQRASTLSSEVSKMTSESLRSTSPRRSPTPVPAGLQLPSGKEVSEILQQMSCEISQSTTAEIVEIANAADSRSKLRDLLPVYFYSWLLQGPEAVITHLLLHYFILWRDCGELRRDRQVFEEHIERLKGRVGELEELREPSPEIGRLARQVQDLKMKNEKLQHSHDEVSMFVCLLFPHTSIEPVCMAVLVCVCDSSQYCVQSL